MWTADSIRMDVRQRNQRTEVVQLFKLLFNVKVAKSSKQINLRVGWHFDIQYSWSCSAHKRISTFSNSFKISQELPYCEHFLAKFQFKYYVCTEFLAKNCQRRSWICFCVISELFLMVYKTSFEEVCPLTDNSGTASLLESIIIEVL